MSQAVSTREKILTAIRGARPKSESGSTGTPRPELQLIPPPDDPEILVERFMLLAREEAATTEWVPEAVDVPGRCAALFTPRATGPWFDHYR